MGKYSFLGVLLGTVMRGFSFVFYLFLLGSAFYFLNSFGEKRTVSIYLGVSDWQLDYTVRHALMSAETFTIRKKGSYFAQSRLGVLPLWHYRKISAEIYLTADHQYLLVGHTKGLVKINLKTGSMKRGCSFSTFATKSQNQPDLEQTNRSPYQFGKLTAIPSINYKGLYYIGAFQFRNLSGFNDKGFYPATTKVEATSLSIGDCG